MAWPAGISGTGVGGEGVTPSCDLKPPWPIEPKGRAFESFLNDLDLWLHCEPKTAASCRNFDNNHIINDMDNYNNIATSNKNLSIYESLKY